jgi:hypothetical protein
MATKLHFYCEGPVRGNCGHKHTTRTGALRCLKDDMRSCNKQGGYSDRSAYDNQGNRYVEAEDWNDKDILVSEEEYAEED